MIHSRAILLASAILLSATSFGFAAAEDDVKAAYEAWNAAFNSGDATQVAATYADDAIFLPPTHAVVEGPAAIGEFFAPLFANGVTGHELELISVREDGDEIVAAAKWKAQGKDASGAVTPIGGLATHVFARQPDGNLKLVLHTFN